MIDFIKNLKTCDKAAAIFGAAEAVLSFVDIIRYAVLGEPAVFVTMLLVRLLFVVLAAAAVFARAPIAFLPICVLSAVLFFTMNNFGTTLFNFTFAVDALVSAAGAVTGTVLCILGREKPKLICMAALIAAAVVLVVTCLCAWSGLSAAAKGRENVQSEFWAVPEAVDLAVCPEEGRLEKIDYETKAYATDNRSVKKSAYVYLPYGYDEAKQYNILYLLHGTGDDEEYWLKKFAYNKTMVDNLIYRKDIEPLIIVTPTFYVENDCLDGLDALSYSFGTELKNDIMPAVESKYSTCAESTDQKGFEESRRHRAFAGLSRGAVTTLHSVMCGSLEYFSYFGTFSASRTSKEYFAEKNGGDNSNLPIDYWYVASGAFDFGFKSQWSDWNAIVDCAPRLTKGENTSFDVYPMRYHSMGNWHLALYNFLQKIF